MADRMAGHVRRCHCRFCAAIRFAERIVYQLCAGCRRVRERAGTPLECAAQCDQIQFYVYGTGIISSDPDCCPPCAPVAARQDLLCGFLSVRRAQFVSVVATRLNLVPFGAVFPNRGRSKLALSEGVGRAAQAMAYRSCGCRLDPHYTMCDPTKAADEDHVQSLRLVS